jgi:hypothetical protein
MHHEFVPDKQTVNGKFYKEVINRFIALVHYISPLRDNAPARSLGPYSPNLAVAGLFPLFI